MASPVITLSRAEFDVLIPISGTQGIPLPSQFLPRTPGPIHCDVLGAALFVRGDCWPIKAALGSFGFLFNPALTQWEAPFALDTVQAMMR
jgi:hypothetical protein